MTKSALFSLGFRPFFLLASLFSAIALALWAMVFADKWQLPVFSYYPMIIWHAHEMIFAYSMAVIAGFLLTAIKNWTGIQTVNGGKLALLASIWLLARILPFVINNHWVIAIVDMLFLPLLAVFIALPLIKVGNKRNYFMIVLISVFAGLNLLLHLELLGFVQNMAQIAYKSAFYLIIALIIIMAGRVFPMFSQNGVPQRYQVTKYPIIEKLALPSYFIFALSILFVPIKAIVIITALFAFVVHSIRLKGWYNRQIWQVPLVWVLHSGYAFLLLGFIFSIISQYNMLYTNLALHAFSIGTLGIITIGMMARVSVGHTGRNLRFPPKVLKISFPLMLLAAFVRIILPTALPNAYHILVIIAASLWSLAFLLFFISYVKMWIQPRVD
ncbi:MAG TPA: NnrS family protein [Oceanospirillales bacterium]|nr:NnrS family protein [Oceanospirillales bacterium]